MVAVHWKVGLFERLADNPHADKMRADIASHVTYFLANWSPDCGAPN
jgi:hypothetical protein